MSEPIDERSPCAESAATFPRFSLVRDRQTKAIGRYLYDSFYGAFVEWDDGPRFVERRDLEPLGGAGGRLVADLVAIVRWLHPDPVPDPQTMSMARRHLGDHAAVLMSDIVGAKVPQFDGYPATD